MNTTKTTCGLDLVVTADNDLKPKEENLLQTSSTANDTNSNFEIVAAIKQ